MKKILKGTLLIALLPILLTSCEQMFTYSMFEWAQRDPSNLSEAQQVSYAQNVLGTGDQQAMADAYEAIKDNSDPEVQLLASKLAVGASGLNEAVESAIADLDAIEDGTKDINDYLNTIDIDMLNNAVDSMSKAANDPSTEAEITSEEYITASAAGLISAVNSGDADNYEEGVTAIQDATPDNSTTATWDQKAAFFLQESGYDSTDLDSLVNLNA